MRKNNLTTNADDLLPSNGSTGAKFGQRGAVAPQGDETDPSSHGRSGLDLINGWEGPDKLVGGAGSDTLSGGSGNDTLVGGAGSDEFVFYGEPGNDTVRDFHHGDLIRIDGVFDNVEEALAAVVYSPEGAVIDLGDGSTITLQGVTSLSEADFIITPPINDDPPSDDCDSGDGETLPEQDDVLRGTSGPDTIDGGAGNDAIWGDLGDDSLIGSSGNDFLLGQSNNDTLDGGTGHDSLHGGGGDDVIDGGCGDDQVVGLSGNDILNGGHGNDTIAGDIGSDTINGGEGDDLIFSGGGNDTFLYASGDQADTITDFTAGADTEDVIDLTDFGLTDMDDLLALATDFGTYVVIDFGGGDTLTLSGVQTTDLHSDDFWF